MDEDASQPNARFPPTRWSLVLDVKTDNQDRRQKALSELCQAYWEPVYAFLRKSGQPIEQAEDLTQGFFLDFLKRGSFEKASQNRGRMRNFLLGALKNFVSKSYASSRTQKRGSGLEVLSLDAEEAEGRYLNDAQTAISPDLLFERRWAERLFERAFTRARDFYQERGKTALFETLKSSLSGGGTEVSYAQVATEQGETENSIAVFVHRMRQRFRKLLEEEIRDTITCEEDFEDELHNLHRIFQNQRSQL